MTDQTQPDPDPQISEPAGRDGPAYLIDPIAGVASLAPSASPSPSTLPPPSSASLRRYEKGAVTLLRRLGADPDAISSQEEGRWPTTWQSFLWDLAPDTVAPPRDGVVLPQWNEPPWLTDLPDDQVDRVRKVVRAELERRLQSVAALELKATRLLTPFVALLTGAAALTIFQVSAVETSLAGVVALVGAGFGAGGIAFLLVGMLRALDADTRLGTSPRATLEQDVHDDGRFALRNDTKGVDAAKFVLRMKGTRILFARAAISRGLVMLLFSSFAGAAALVLTPNEGEISQPIERPAPASPPPTVTPSPTLSATPSVHRRSPTDSVSPSPSGSQAVSPTTTRPPPSGRTTSSPQNP